MPYVQVDVQRLESDVDAAGKPIYRSFRFNTDLERHESLIEALKKQKQRGDLHDVKVREMPAEVKPARRAAKPTASKAADPA